MADNCANMESIYLGGFCRVTDTGFKTLLHSCSSLYKLKVCHGSQLTDLVFHDIAATSLSLTLGLVCNTVLNLRCCKNLGDEALPAVSSLRELKMLQLDNSDITDAGMAYLRHGIISSLISLSIRGYKKLTDKCISVLFDGSSKLTYRIFLIYPIMAFLLLQEAKFQFPNSDCDNVHSKVILQSWPHLPLWFNSDSNS
ncbi:hypothetical protein V6N11_020314 [Hibiscus sabdariffa]|uniref:F-box/LRR-repeat protein 15-like leucin rich repeat domain-containing protein n=1 Tax=Hibiscus sabdariffa TaxID=183260 RepID=A0ABR2Q820_9ROSI